MKEEGVGLQGLAVLKNDNSVDEMIRMFECTQMLYLTARTGKMEQLNYSSS